MTFGTFGHTKVREKEKFLYDSTLRQQAAALLENQSPVNSQNKKSNLSSAFSFAIAAAKEKATKKKSAVIELSRSAERDRRHRRLGQAFEKA